MVTGQKVFASILSIISVVTIASATYIGVSYANRNKNGLYEAIEITNTDNPISSELDLGVIYPGETKKQTIKVTSKLAYSVNYTVDFEGNTLSDAAKYIDVKAEIDGETICSSLMSVILENEEKIMKRKLSSHDSEEVLFSYTLINDIPEEIVNKTISFDVVFLAKATI